MNVNFFATLRFIVGAKTVAFPYGEGMTLRQLIEVVLDRYPALRPELIDENGQLYGHVHVMVNGRDAPYLDKGIDTRLRQEDTISFFPAVGGG